MGKSALLIVLAAAAVSAQGSYDNLLTAGDVETAAGMKGVKAVPRGSQAGAGGHLNFAGPDGKLIVMANFGDAQLYRKAHDQKDMTVGGQTIPMPLFAHAVAGVGDEAFAAPPGAQQYVLYARRGNQSVSLSTYFSPRGPNGIRPLLSMAQLEQLARLIFSRW